MTSTTPTDHALILAGIIRQVDEAHDLSADALASAILAHPDSRWGAAEPPSDRPKVERTFYEYEIFDKNYITVADGIANSHKKARSKIQEYLAQHQNKTHHLELRCIQVLNTDALQSQQEQAEAAPTFPHISDSLMRSLICDIVAMLSEATEAALFGNQINPLEEIRARLMEILRLAAQDEAKLHKIDP